MFGENNLATMAFLPSQAASCQRQTTPPGAPHNPVTMSMVMDFHRRATLSHGACKSKFYYFRYKALLRKAARLRSCSFKYLGSNITKFIQLNGNKNKPWSERLHQSVCTVVHLIYFNINTHWRYIYWYTASLWHWFIKNILVNVGYHVSSLYIPSRSTSFTMRIIIPCI